MSLSMTWANYALVVSVCLVVYYFIVLFIYRKKLHSTLRTDASSGVSSLVNFSSDEMESTNSKNLNLFGEEVKDEVKLAAMGEEQDFSPDAQDFADEIVAYTSSCGDSIEKEELLQNLGKIIQKYPSLVNSDAKYELNQLIAISTENYCSIHVSADELRELWKG